MKHLVRHLSSLLLLVVVTFASAQSPSGGSSSNPKNAPAPLVRQNVHHDVSQPLRDLARNAPAVGATPQEEEAAEEVKVIPLPSGFKPATEPDSVLQDSLPIRDNAAAAAFAPAMGLNFEGLGSGFPNYTVNVAPPDTNGAVGLTQYVQWVNLSFAVFDKTTGKVLMGPVKGNTLWTSFGGGCETNNDGDPVVTYDKLADRWVFSQFVVRSQPFLQCVAVSTTSDATGTYNRYSFEYSNFDDYPKMGVWPDAYYETFNMFIGGATFAGADVCAYDRQAMLNGQPATQVCFQQAPTVGGVLPADLDGHISPPPGSPNYLLEFDVNALNLYKFHVDFVTPGNSTFTGPIKIPVAPFTPFCPTVHGCVPQPGGDGTNLDSLGDRLMHRLAYRNFGDHESLVVNHSVVADPVNQNSGIRWYEIQNPNGTPTVAQQSTFAPDPSFRWMGSVAMDASGNLAVGYSVINSTSAVLPASIAIAARGEFDPPGVLQSESMIVIGTGVQTSGLTRWGDYSAMQVDPADDCTFWYTTEYLQNSGSFNWNTRIANFKFPGCGATALSLTKTHAGNFTQGQTGAAYSLVVTNIGSKATDGTAITVTDTLPTGLTATAITSTDPLWVCTLGTLSCTRTDVLASGKSYPAITVTVNVAANAPGLLTNTATVTGGGNKDNVDNTAQDVTTVIVTGPDPAVAMTHVPLVQGQSTIYTITVTNRGLSATTADPVIVTDTMPAGLTATAAGGTGWGTCTVTPTSVSCTRSDSLASNQGYPPIVVSVNITAKALTTVVNTATVSGGGDMNPFNNTANDPATVLSTAPGLAFTNPPVPQVPSVALEFKPGVQIAITGTATGLSFQDFKLQWAEGINPSTGFSSTGITVAGGGGTPVTNSPLGTWDTSGITQADFYTVRVTVDNAGYSNFAQTIIYLDPSLLSVHWPIALDASPLFYSGFQTLSDGAGNQRLFMVRAASLFAKDSRPAYQTFSPDGSSQTSTPLSFPSQLNPAAGQVDGFPGGDAVVPDRSPDTQATQLHLFHSDNSSTAVPLPANPLGLGFDFEVPVLEDVEGKGQLDLVILNARTALETQAFLTASRPDGSLVSPNFPVAIPDQVVNISPGLAITFKPRVLVGDLGGDGSKEFVVIAGLSTSTPTFTLLKFSHDGTPIPWAVPQFSGTPAAMVLADLDHNGMLETILAVALGTDFEEDSLIMHVFQPDGTERPGWPVNLGGINPDDFTFSQIMVGDLNRDGVEEIIWGNVNGGLTVLEPDGTAFPGFSSPLINGFFSGSMALADIDGDGFPEILTAKYLIAPSPTSPASSSAGGPLHVRASVGVNGSMVYSASPALAPSAPGVPFLTHTLLAIRSDGTIARTWNLQGSDGNQPFGFAPSITVGDFNNDGLTDIAVTYMNSLGGGVGGFGGGGAAVVFTTGTPFNATVNDWPLVYQNPHNTAVMRRTITVVLTSPVGGGTVAGTTPITAVTIGNVTSVQFKIDGANLGAPITTAPFTLQWDTTQASPGAHSLLAEATDGNGQLVPSVPLTVNVIRGSTSAVNVALTGGTNSSTFGDSLTFTATISPNTATGKVTFFDGLTPISGAVSVSGGAASLTTTLLNTGSRNITARYSGDSAVGGSVSVVLTQTIQPAPLTVKANDCSRPYGSSALNCTGSISGAKNGDTFTIHFSSTATITSPVGTYPLTPSLTGLDLANYSVTAVNATLTVTQAASVTTLTSSNTNVDLGVSVTFFAFITSTTTGLPTGSAQFLDGSVVLGTVPLAGFGASFTTASLAAGSHSITAHYLGDANFLSSVSPAVVQQISSQLGISITASPSSATIKAGSSATFSFTITPDAAFNQTVTFSCSGLPALSSCSFVPPSVTPNGSPATSILTITTTAPSSSSAAPVQTPSGPGTSLPVLASLFGTSLVAGLVFRLRRKSSISSQRAEMWLSIAVLCVIVALTSCGGGSGTPPPPPPPQGGTPPGTSQISVTVSAGSNSKSAMVTLVVQ